MQTVMSNFIKLLFCLGQGACWDSFHKKVIDIDEGKITLCRRMQRATYPDGDLAAYPRIR